MLVSQLSPAEAQVVTSIDSMLRDPQGERASVNARLDRILESCMAAQGQKYSPSDSGAIRVDLGGGIIRYGEVAAVHSPTAPRPSPSLSRQWLQAYINEAAKVTFRLPDGSEGALVTGGCLGQSLRQVFGANLRAFARARMVGENFLPNVVREALQSPAMTRALPTWRKCSLASGVNTAFPWSVIRDPGQASANVGCIHKSGLASAYIAAFRESVHHRYLIDGSTVTTWFTLLRKANSADTAVGTG